MTAYDGQTLLRIAGVSRRFGGVHALSGVSQEVAMRVLIGGAGLLCHARTMADYVREVRANG
ncbi:MAG TPA: hypothetical protein VMW62_10965 [Chloroflexota bacterium]|nr:hypothetical protein [Chloroflexota bacterium]